MTREEYFQSKTSGQETSPTFFGIRRRVRVIAQFRFRRRTATAHLDFLTEATVADAMFSLRTQRFVYFRRRTVILCFFAVDRQGEKKREEAIAQPVFIRRCLKFECLQTRGPTVDGKQRTRRAFVF